MSNPPPDQRWLERIDLLLTESSPRVPLTYAVEADRLAQIDTVCYAFYEFRPIAKKRWELWYESFKEGRVRRLGGLDENLTVVNKHHDWIVKELGTPRCKRPRPPHEKNNLVLLDYGSDAISSLVRGVEATELDRCGVAVLCAIEKFNVVHGRYPAALDELVPGQLKSVALDPWSGRPFSYKALAPGVDEHGRRYLLYTWGNDNIDDGGKEPRSAYDALGFAVLGNLDYIINYVEKY